MSDKIFIPKGILGIQSGTIGNVVIQKNNVIRIKKDKPINKK